MTYDTHEKVSKVFYFLTLPLLVIIGIFPQLGLEISENFKYFLMAMVGVVYGLSFLKIFKKKFKKYSANKTLIVALALNLGLVYLNTQNLEIMTNEIIRNIFNVALTITLFISAVVIGYKGAIWGSGYPDLDIAGSTPDRRTPVLGSVMRAFGVVHRGKFSHSLDSITLTFGIVLVAFHFLAGNIVSGPKAEELGIIAEMLKEKGTIYELVKIFIITAYIGAVSHLFGDMSTKSGIRILFFLDPFRLVPKKSSYFKTGMDDYEFTVGSKSYKIKSWESLYNDIFSVLVPISTIVSIYLVL